MDEQTVWIRGCVRTRSHDFDSICRRGRARVIQPGARKVDEANAGELTPSAAEVGRGRGADGEW